MSEERLADDQSDETEDFDLGEPDDAPEPEPDTPEPQPEPEPPSRAGPPSPRQQRRDERNRERARELEQQNNDLARRLAELERRQQQPVIDPAAAQREEQAFRERLSQMDPVEAALEIQSRAERRMQAQLRDAEIRGFDRADVAEFNALVARDRFAERNAAEVERVLAARRAMGDYTLGRLDIVDFLRGREARLRGGTAATQQRRQAAARVARETVRPTAGGGDVARSGGGARREDADASLLRQITTSDIGW